MKDPRAGMQRIWFEEENMKNPLKPFIRDTKNGALKALFWLSKDIFGYELSQVQNVATIRSLQLRDTPVAAGDTQIELERMAMSNLFKARNALSYLGFTIGLEKK